ncbi:hypothetical protein PG985_012690 [Apiospora marii]|uniref:Uncharacterized protein n=1 Tax=Apiospora marii TaxID=335849 RepID=A0ABR1RCY6_9PEZI
MTTTKTLEELAASISKHAAIASEYLREHNLPTPSLLDGTALDTSSLPPAIQAACLAVQDASLELHELVQGPRAILMNFSTNAKADAATIFQFGLPQKVPLDSAVTLPLVILASLKHATSMLPEKFRLRKTPFSYWMHCTTHLILQVLVKVQSNQIPPRW